MDRDAFVDEVKVQLDRIDDLASAMLESFRSGKTRLRRPKLDNLQLAVSELYSLLGLQRLLE